MCGIAGTINWNAPYDEQMPVLQNMQQTLARRGPNRQGIYTSASASLIHTALDVTSCKNNRQPMTFCEGTYEYVLLYDGRLYNTNELKEELEGLGHRFIGYSDTEVLLHAYIQWKERCVSRLNGIFAFAVWENHNRRLFFARDRIGVKPLFYTQKKGAFIFASEIKTLLAHPMVEPKVDQNSIADIMLLGPGRTPGYGVFKGIEEVLPGYYGFYDCQAGNLRLLQYWRLEDKEHADSFKQTVEKVRALVLDSVNRQLISDVPVGTFLSGGLDSSIITAVAGKQIPNLHTFSVDYKDNELHFKSNRFQPDNDQPFIDEMVKQLGKTGIKHHRILLDTEDIVNALYDAVDARDLPGMADIDSSLLLFAKEAKKYVTVAHSGECADEIFGGYPWFRDKDIREYNGFPWSRSLEYRMSFLSPEVYNIVSPSYVSERYENTIKDTHVLPDASPLERRMKEMVNLNFKWFMQTLLDRTDRMSMFGGLEVRVPFCDYRIAEYLYTVPWEMKDYQGREKGLLRHAMAGLLPENVLWRKKSPYPKTHNPAYLSAVSTKLKEVIESPSEPVQQFVSKSALANLITEGPAATGSTPWYGQLMTTPQTIAYFLQINYWLKKYHVHIL